MRWDRWFRLADRLGIHLHDAIGWPGPITWRQSLAWEEWFRLDFERPNRSDHYAMQTASYLRTDNPTFEQLTIKARKGEAEKPKLTPEQEAEARKAAGRAAKARWAALGLVKMKKEKPHAK